jgi:hypothetical protein
MKVILFKIFTLKADMITMLHILLSSLLEMAGICHNQRSNQFMQLVMILQTQGECYSHIFSKYPLH